MAPSYSVAQDSIIRIAYLEAERLLRRVAGRQSQSAVAFDEIYGPAAPVNDKVVPLGASRCDMHPCSGRVDPDPILPPIYAARDS